MAEQAYWYVVHTYSGYENKVATELMTMVENRRIQDLICDVKVPTETVLEEVLAKRGNKTGEMDTTENDAAIIYGKYCDYILVVLSSD